MTASARNHLTPPQTVVSATTRELSYRQFRLRVTAGLDAGRSVCSTGATSSIGTATGNHAILTDRAVSRHHCEIEAIEDGFMLRDLDSTNGTTVDGVRVSVAYLVHGSVIGVGDSRLRIEILDDRVREALSDADRFGPALGSSAAMRRVFAAIARSSTVDVTILLEGETGTGKGLLAEAIHAASPRATAPFVVVDCGSLPPTLIESELFGHARGAFTDAREARIGAFESAQGGTVFLDEIGELPLDMQPRLLRALDSRTVRPIGGSRTVPLDVRIIAATNRDLRHEINQGRFRADLFYRLDVARVRLPPLRERREDIPQLAVHFYRQLSRDPAAAPPSELLAWVAEQRWPGNVRELRAAIERAVLFGDPAVPESADHDPIEGHDTGADLVERAAAPAELFTPGVSFHEAKQRVIAHWEHAYLRELVRHFEGNLSRAGRSVSVDRNHLRALLRRHALPRRQ